MSMHTSASTRLLGQEARQDGHWHPCGLRAACPGDFFFSYEGLEFILEYTEKNRERRIDLNRYRERGR